MNTEWYIDRLLDRLTVHIFFFLLDKTRRDTSLSVRDIITCTYNSSPDNLNKG